MIAVRRCAVYTRKSSEEGLEQAFNSLHAQREACEAYIKSQAHEGWKLVRTAYDDGGLSGGSMERPALQRLLAEVTAGRINVIVVYKVDRLTRSLADFARIVEALDSQGASFVSITQQFNTTTSMGRLTLNVLLSFAQFEREVTSERIRDKIAASKRKGMWMGGSLPLGYDVRDRELVVNEAEAKTVREIIEAYVRLGTVAGVRDDLRRRGILSKRWTSSTGRTWGYPSAGALCTGCSAIRCMWGRSLTRGRSTRGSTRPSSTAHSGTGRRNFWRRRVRPGSAGRSSPAGDRWLAGCSTTGAER
jgi:site-specific DNA recombinase